MLPKNEIEQYIKMLRTTQIVHDSEAPKKENKKSVISIFKPLFFIFKSVVDFLLLKLLLLFPKYRNKKIVYTSARFTTSSNGIVEDRIVKPLFVDNILFINQSKEIWINKINNQKVYNVGGIAKIISFFSKEPSSLMQNFYAYQLVNKWILNSFISKEIYFLVHYDLGNLAIIFSNYRHKLKLIEIQHGGIINYFPYINRAPIKMIDLFYVKNKPTIDYLKNHLCKDFNSEYKLLPYPNSQKKYTEGKHILYASTVEFNGIHPVFLEFLKTNEVKNLNLYIRLHPREKDKIELFKKQLENVKANIVFDESKNWLESNTIKNLIVVSPWSSVIEDAADNGFKTIILEPFGKERFGYLIDDQQVFFTPNIEIFKVKLNFLFNL